MKRAPRDLGSEPFGYKGFEMQKIYLQKTARWSWHSSHNSSKGTKNIYNA
jgi:hypothetical protein